MTMMSLNGDATVDQFVVDLNDALTSKNKEATKAILEKLLGKVVEGGPIVEWITDPSTFTHLKESFATIFAAPRKAMQLKARIPNRHRRAIMFVKALQNGMSRAE